jgi:hypothetical protein
LAHQDGWVAYAMPMSIDGMMAIASVAHYRDRMTGRRTRAWGWFALWFGLGLSIYANGASYVAVWGWQFAWLAWACLPPALLLVSIEVMSHPGRVRQIAEFGAAVIDKARATAAGAVGEPAPVATDSAPSRAMPAPAASQQAPTAPAHPGRVVEPVRPQLSDASEVIDAEVVDADDRELVVVAANGNGSGAGRDHRSTPATAGQPGRNAGVTARVPDATEPAGRGGRTARKSASGTRYQKPEDEARIARLKELAAKTLDGKVPVREAARELQIGRDAAARLLDLAGLGRDDDPDRR